MMIILFQKDNIFGASASLRYDPQLQIKLFFILWLKSLNAGNQLAWVNPAKPPNHFILS